MRDLTLYVGTSFLAALHLLWYSRVVALRLWELTGGIYHEGQVTTYGTSDRAWTVPVQLPAGLLFVVGLDAVGFLFVCVGSLAAGFAAVEFLLVVALSMLHLAHVVASKDQ